jgi:hypothetical protein
MSESNRTGLTRAVLWVGAFVPAVLACVFYARGAASQVPTPAAEPRPALAFDQYMVDEGTVEPTGLVYARFGFTNKGRETVHIKELVPSCGCLKPRLEQTTYEPGEPGQFFLTVETPNEEPGRKEYFVTVKYKDPQPREVQLTFKMRLMEQDVTVRPKALLFYVSETAPPPQKIVVSDRRAKLKITSVECTSPHVSVKIDDSAGDEAQLGEIHLAVAVDAQAPSGTYALLKLNTDDPQYPALHMPISVKRFDAASLESPRAEPAPEPAATP